MNNLSLLPYPRSLTSTPNQYLIEPGRRIVLQSTEPSRLLFGAQRLQAALREHAGADWEISATTAGPASEIGAVLRIALDQVMHPQGYKLSITPDTILAEAPTPTGIFYAVCTLIQMLEQSGRQLPCLDISDWPDFAARGVMLDVSRDKVPTMDTLLTLVDMLAGWKINQLQLYTEHTFAYRDHPEVWAKASPLTGQEMLELDAYCQKRYIELVPNQNSFGHLHRWLIHERYARLSEVIEGFYTPWGYIEGPFSLCPGDPGSLDLMRSLYDELLPHFSSRMFNVGCDETFDLGQGRSRDVVEQYGEGRIYLDFLLKIYHEVKAHGRTVQFWGDIIVQHPDLIAELPRDVIALEWGYDADHPFDTHCPQFRASGIPFYVCPGTSSWCSLGGRSDNAIGNLRNAAENGSQYGAIGYLITDWGDLGHWQMLPISFLGFAVGAAYAWALDANRDMDVPRALSWHAFRDATGAMGSVAYELGNVARAVGLERRNSSVLFWILQRSFEQLRRYQRLPREVFEKALAAIDSAMQPLSRARITRPDAVLIVQEFELTARLLRHACQRGLLLLDSGQAEVTELCRELDEDLRQIIAEYERLWLARNRYGGLIDSVARLEKARIDYQMPT